MSAFRDKLERCHRSDCVLDNDWSAFKKGWWGGGWIIDIPAQCSPKSRSHKCWTIVGAFAKSFGIYIRWMRRYYQTYGKEMVARQREGAIVRFGKEHFNERWLPGFRNLTERERYNIPKLGFLVVSLSETTSELLCHIRHMEGWHSCHPGKGLKSTC